jgi:dUTP pyrophosphatase
MSPPPSPVCYLAHPVDFTAQTDTPHNAGYIRQSLLDAGFVVYSPALAFRAPASAAPGPVIWQVDQFALSKCQAACVLYPEDKSVGTSMELQCALDLGLPTLVISRTVNRSWSLAGLPSEQVRVTRYPGKWEYFKWLFTEADTSRRASPPRQPLFTQLLSPQAQLPSRAYSGDAGFDLYSAEELMIEPGQTVDVPSQVAVQLPEGVWGLILGRSSTLRNCNLLVNPGVIDTGWRGGLFVNVKNLNQSVPFLVVKGQRLGQLIPLPNLAAGLVPTPVDRLDQTDRGVSGFGSSGA